MKSFFISVLLLVFGSASFAQTPQLYSSDGQYLGNLSSNQYDPNSVSNPYGRYGSQYSPDSINNPYGKYGSPYSPNSVNNPYANSDDTPRIVAPSSGLPPLAPLSPLGSSY